MPISDDTPTSGWSRVFESIEFGLSRCLSEMELLERAGRIWETRNARFLFKRIVELSSAGSFRPYLLQLVNSLSNSANSLASRERARADRFLAKLFGLLAPDELEKIHPQFLLHRRKSVRLGYWAAFRNICPTPDLTLAILRTFSSTGDEELLKLIAHHPAAIRVATPHNLLPYISDQYWRTRIVEAALSFASETELTQLSSDYEREFVWAVGRAIVVRHRDVVRGIARRNLNNPKILSLAIWSLGQLRDKDGITALFELLQARLALDGVPGQQAFAPRSIEKS